MNNYYTNWNCNFQHYTATKMNIKVQVLKGLQVKQEKNYRYPIPQKMMNKLGKIS